jgi:5-methylcytosine-specific restriction enzyme subunit McrC
VAAPSIRRICLTEYGDTVPLAALVGSDDLPHIEQKLRAAGTRVRSVLGLEDDPVTWTAAGIRAERIAGLIKVSALLELEIAPKFLGCGSPTWREDFFLAATLSKYGHIFPRERLAAAAGARGDLASLLARWIIESFWANHRRPLRTYRRHRVEEFAIDGEVDPEEFVAPQPDGYRQQIVLFDRQNAFNSVIRQAVLTLTSEVTDPALRGQLGRVLEHVGYQKATPRRIPARLPSRSGSWQSLYEVSRLVLEGFGVSFNPRRIVGAPGFVVDTWRVWQDLVGLGLRIGAPPGHVQLQARTTLGTGQRRNEETRTICVTPDVVLAISGNERVIIDAKYKGRVAATRTRVAESDLYESLAFARAHNLQKVILVYPRVASTANPSEPVGTASVFDEIQVGDVRIAAVEIEVRGLSGRNGLRTFAKGLTDGIRAAAGPNS